MMVEWRGRWWQITLQERASELFHTRKVASLLCLREIDKGDVAVRRRQRSSLVGAFLDSTARDLGLKPPSLVR